MTLESKIKGLFVSSPYPGDQKFGGQPTGLLYALSVLADRKEQEYQDRNKVKDEIEVWCPAGVEDFESSSFKRELSDYLRENSPKIVGVSTFSVSYQNSVNIRDLVKQISPETVVVFGGAHEDNFVKHYKTKGTIDADFVIAGDGMFLLDELYRLIEENPTLNPKQIKEKVTQERDRFAKLNGAGVLLYKDGSHLRYVDSQADIVSSLRKPIHLDEIPILPRYLMKGEDEISRQFSIFDGNKTAQVMIGQGCPFGCGFCSEGIKKVFFEEDAPRSVEPARNLSHVEKELQELRNAGYEAIFFDDSTFFAKEKNYMSGLVDLIKKYNFKWGCQTTQNTIHSMANLGLLSRMRDSGLKYVYIGIEHYDGQIRDSFGKSIGGGNKFNGYSIEDTLTLLHQNGIKVGVSLTFGHPDPESPEEETRETKTTAKYAIDRTAELIQQFPNIEGVSLNLITYHPGTPISERYEKKLGKVDYIGHPNKREPFTHFEEGVGQHPKGMTPELAGFIINYSRKTIPKDKLWI